MLPMSFAVLAEGDGQALAIMMSETLEGLDQGGVGRDGGEVVVQDVAGDDQLGEFALHEMALHIVQRDDAAETAVRRGDIEIAKAMRDELLGDGAEVGVLVHVHRVGFHEVGHAQAGQLLAVDLAAFALQRFGVDGFFLERQAGVVGDDAGQHEREDDLVIERKLEKHDDRHDRRVGGGGEKGAHAPPR